PTLLSPPFAITFRAAPDFSLTRRPLGFVPHARFEDGLPQPIRAGIKDRCESQLGIGGRRSLLFEGKEARYSARPMTIRLLALAVALSACRTAQPMSLPKLHRRFLSHAEWTLNFPPGRPSPLPS